MLFFSSVEKSSDFILYAEIVSPADCRSKKMTMDGCLQFIKCLVYGFLLLSATDGSMVWGIPAFRKDAIGGTEVNLLLVYG